MSASLSRWLTLREEADHAVRSEALTRRVVDALAPVDAVSVLDLAAGTGSNLRFLAGRLPRRQHWLLVDRDASLLSRVRDRTAASPIGRSRTVDPVPGGCVVHGGGLECHVEARCLDLDRLDDSGIFEGRHLVTASALLDLVSEHWLRTLAMRCRTAGAAALFTITYNGRFSCSPAEPEDDMVRRLMNEHQKRDKGLGGPAAGPDAADVAEQCFRDEGYIVQREPSDWVLDGRGGRPPGPASDRGSDPGSDPAALRPRPGLGSDPGDLHDFHRELIDGWAVAAAEVAPDLAATIARWRARRFEHVAAGRSRLIVGHDDLAAWLPRG